MSSGLPSGTHRAHLRRPAFIVRRRGEERGVGSREQVMAAWGTRTDGLETSKIPFAS